MIQRIYDINRVLELKEKLYNHPRLRAFLGQQLIGEKYRSFIKEFNRLLPGKTREQVIGESLLHLAGQTLTEDSLDENAWRIAGNMPRIEAWRPVVPWNRQVDHEYVPVQIIAAYRTVLHGKAAATFDFQVLAGTPATCTIVKTWSRNLCGALARRLGFSSYKGDYPFEDPLQFVNLRMYALVDPSMSGSSPDFEEVWCEDNGKKIRPSSCFNYNRKLLRMRRRNGFTCPKKYDKDHHPCHLCHVGQEECLCSVHDLTFVKKQCSGCSNKEAWFDPAFPQRNICVDCYHKSLYRRDK